MEVWRSNSGVKMPAKKTKKEMADNLRLHLEYQVRKPLIHKAF